MEFNVILNKISSLINNPEMSDIEFRIGKNETRVYAHKLILSSRSIFFKELLYPKNWKLKQTQVLSISIPDIKEDAFHEIIRYLYKGQISLDEKKIWDILLSAKRFQLSDLYEKCDKFLKNLLNRHNCLSLYRKVAQFQLYDLSPTIIETIQNNSKEIFKNTDSLIDFERSILIFFLSQLKFSTTNLLSQNDLKVCLVEWFFRRLQTKNEKKFVQKKHLNDKIFRWVGKFKRNFFINLKDEEFVFQETHLVDLFQFILDAQNHQRGEGIHSQTINEEKIPMPSEERQKNNSLFLDNSNFHPDSSNSQELLLPKTTINGNCQGIGSDSSANLKDNQNLFLKFDENNKDLYQQHTRNYLGRFNHKSAIVNKKERAKEKEKEKSIESESKKEKGKEKEKGNENWEEKEKEQQTQNKEMFLKSNIFQNSPIENCQKNKIKVVLISTDKFEKHLQDVVTSICFLKNVENVEIIHAQHETPSFQILKQYNVAFIFSSINAFHNSIKLGNELALFYDHGGGVVISTYRSLIKNPKKFKGSELLGKIVSHEYLPILRGNIQEKRSQLGEILMDNHPLINEVTHFTGGTLSYRIEISSLRQPKNQNHSQIVAKWKDGNPLILSCTNENTNGKIIILNMWPVSGACYGYKGKYNYWASKSDGRRIIANSITFASQPKKVGQQL
ncbi:btb (poz) domain-containing 2a-related [Anaeramoeba flamelloides]|uniref:Btb (Poz) domain-containing 2a-related n=1 Tax=Anaeramoeba flamelloides TaxID=1746091 RepID=A0ABQ8YIF8_9EUKA|nr:btb (poz) domain-containing 2a-related [Anaeramoeba flamelloides]